MSTPQEDRRTHEEPPTLRLRSTSPILTVNDIDESIGWYRDVVGFYLKQTWDQDGTVTGAELVAGSESIMLAQDDWAKGRDRAKGEGFRLFFETSQDIDEMAAAIQARGGTLDRGPEDTPWDTRAMALIDPNGFKLTIWAKKEEAAE